MVDITRNITLLFERTKKSVHCSNFPEGYSAVSQATSWNAAFKTQRSEVTRGDSIENQTRASVGQVLIN